MNLILQWSAVALIVVIAVAWAVRRVVSRRRGGASCGCGDDDCGAAASTECPDCPLAEHCHSTRRKH